MTLCKILKNLYFIFSEDEKDGIVCLWKGFHSDIKIQTFDAFAHKIIKRISLGFEHGLFLSTEKEVFVVGSNSHHQLGLGNLTEPSIDSPRLLDYFTGQFFNCFYFLNQFFRLRLAKFQLKILVISCLSIMTKAFYF